MQGDSKIGCSICGTFFNPIHLSEVFEHQHAAIETDKEYWGVRVEEGESNDERSI